MRLHHLAYFTLVLLLTSCGNPVAVKPEKVPVPPASMFLEREYHFSNTQMRDKFLIGYYGSDLLDTTVYLFVLSFKGDTIFKDQWAGRDLLIGAETEGADSVLVKQATENMRKIIDKKLPLHPDSVFNPPLSNLAFSYRTGASGKILEWSDGEQKVLIRE